MAWIDGFSFELPEEAMLAQQSAREFAEHEVLPLAEKIDHEHYFPKELIPKMGALGFMGVCVPEQYDGAGLSQVAYCLIIEELAAACATTSVIASAHNSLCISPIVEFGSEEQKKHYLPPLAKGEHIGCFALSEPGTGSDAASLTCIAKKSGDKYIVNGTKNWITNGPVSDTCVLFATLDTTKGHKGVCAFVHSMKLPGISIGKKENKLGICGSATSSITYEDVELSKEHLLLGEFQGFKVAMSTLNGGRTGIAAQAVGIARAALRDSLSYSKDVKPLENRSVSIRVSRIIWLI